MMTSTFNQVIDGNTFTITMPQNRVSAIIDRVDRFINKKKFDNALETIRPFIGATPVARKVVIENSPEAFIEANRALGRYVVISELVSKFNFTKSQAYYRVRKAGIC